MFLEQFPEDNSKHGWIEVVCGSMFSGKTEELIRRLRRAAFANQKVILFKPKIDNRYSEDSIMSHQGSTLEAISILSANEILAIWDGEFIVAIDEAQFFDEAIVSVCSKLAQNGVRVLIAGLDMDYLGNPFGPMPQLLCIAEYVTKVHAICVSCGSLAQFSHRFNSDKNQVLLGAKESYKPLCRSCYNKSEL
ncbi:MAG: thymidine kinase [Flavobacteriia bacterium]|nr:thymidine kinase [Flavobacteriia bacterium]